jgi:hypothetical protein
MGIVGVIISYTKYHLVSFCFWGKYLDQITSYPGQKEEKVRFLAIILGDDHF